MRLQDHTGIISLRTFYLHLPVFAREKSKKAPVQVYKMISLSRLLLSFQTKKMVIYQKPFCRMRHFDDKNGPPPALFSSHSPWHLFRPDRGFSPCLARSARRRRGGKFSHVWAHFSGFCSLQPGRIVVRYQGMRHAPQYRPGLVSGFSGETAFTGPSLSLRHILFERWKPT